MSKHRTTIFANRNGIDIVFVKIIDDDEEKESKIVSYFVCIFILFTKAPRLFHCFIIIVVSESDQEAFFKP